MLYFHDVQKELKKASKRKIISVCNYLDLVNFGKKDYLLQNILDKLGANYMHSRYLPDFDLHQADIVNQDIINILRD